MRIVPEVDLRFLKKSGSSRVGVFQEVEFSQNGVLQKVVFFKSGGFSRSGVLQKVVFFKKAQVTLGEVHFWDKPTCLHGINPAELYLVNLPNHAHYTPPNNS